MKKATRNNNIDFLRGLATISIIIIHTAWWSGEGYLPRWFSSLTLLVDVPVFMFLAGLSFNYVNSIIKNIKGIIGQWKKWLYFLVFFTIILLVFFKSHINLSEVISWLAYTFKEPKELPIVAGSIWFMKMYIAVSVICSIIICSVNYYLKKDAYKTLTKIILPFTLMLFLYVSAQNGSMVRLQYITFYSFIYLLGYISHEKKITSSKKLIILETSNILILLLTFYFLNIGINSIQNIKFPPSVPYLIFSNLSIMLTWYLKDKLKIIDNNKINYIGKNAIFYYFAQGISSSLLYVIIARFPLHNSIIKFICMLVTNFVLATIIAIFLEKSYAYVTSKLKNSTILNKIKKEID